MKKARQYRRRASECLAFARNARNEEERSYLLIMANTLQRIACEIEQKEVKMSGTPA
jgi:hypothetical protein